MLPLQVHLITTDTGARHFRAHALASEQRIDYQAVRSEIDHWSSLGAALGTALPEPLIHVPETEIGLLDDVRTLGDDELLADLCYRVVAEATAFPEPVICCIAGGRKTMSGHLQTAFSVLARPQDRLVHVLVSPERYEKNRAFFFPTSSTPDARIDLVEIRTPRLFRVLRTGLLSRLPADGTNLRAIIAALEPMNYAKEPDRALVDVGQAPRSGSRVTFESGGEKVGEIVLSPRPLSTLVAFLEYEREDGSLHVDDLIGMPAVDRLRKAVTDLCFTTEYLTEWTDRSAISRSRQELAARLEDVPMAQDYLGFGIERTPGLREPVYRRERRIDVVLRTAPENVRTWKPLRRVEVVPSRRLAGSG